VFIQAACFTFSTLSTTGGHVRQPDRRAVAVRDYQRAVLIARQKPIVGADRVRLLPAIEAALGSVDVGGSDGRANILECEPVRGERRRVRLDAHGRLLPAADAHEADARELRDLRRELRVRQILHLRQRQGRRREGDGEDGGVRRIGLAVDRRIRKVGGQERARRIDGCLHFLLGDVDV
jgi:hypothetical protein